MALYVELVFHCHGDSVERTLEPASSLKFPVKLLRLNQCIVKDDLGNAVCLENSRSARLYESLAVT
jgi:hypothetical protein